MEFFPPHNILEKPFLHEYMSTVDLCLPKSSYPLKKIAHINVNDTVTIKKILPPNSHVCVNIDSFTR